MDLIEAVQSAEPDWQRWTARVAICAARYLSDGAIIVSSHREAPERVELLGFAGTRLTPGSPPFGDVLSQALLCHDELLAWHSELAARLPPGVADVCAPLLRANGAGDALVVVGSAGDHRAGIVQLVERRTKLSPRTRQSLLQMALHFESALRLRSQQQHAIVAMIRPDGRVTHAERERGRSARQARQPRAGDIWTALVDGRWGLLERRDSDGSRYYVAVENGEQAQRYRALSRTEVEVLRLYARGASGKMVGFSLGLSGATVSAAISSAALKLGVRHRAAVIGLAAHLLGSRQVSPTTPLTRAELEVLEHLRQGLTNAQIARRRGSAERTVANQVAAILHKLRLPSRSAVAALGSAIGPGLDGRRDVQAQQGAAVGHHEGA